MSTALIRKLRPSHLSAKPGMCEVSALSHRIRNPCMYRLNDLSIKKMRVKPVNYSKCGYFSAGRWLGSIDLLVRDNYVTNVLLKISGNVSRGWKRGAQDLDLAAQLHLAVVDRPKGPGKINSVLYSFTQQNF